MQATVSLGLFIIRVNTGLVGQPSGPSNRLTAIRSTRSSASLRLSRSYDGGVLKLEPARRIGSSSLPWNWTPGTRSPWSSWLNRWILRNGRDGSLDEASGCRRRGPLQWWGDRTRRHGGRTDCPSSKAPGTRPAGPEPSADGLV